MREYKEKEQSKQIIYLDANNLYGYAICQYLPYKSFEWNNYNWTIEDILNIPSDNNIGYLFNVDLEYPKELHDKLNDYPLCPINSSIKKEWLSSNQQSEYKESKVEKLITTLQNKTSYTVNYRYLQLCIRLGLIIKVSKVLRYEQKPFMKSYIDLNQIGN